MNQSKIHPLKKNFQKKKRICDIDDAGVKINEAFVIMKSISEKKPAVNHEYSPFATYIDTKLKIFSPHEKAILENQIQNLIFNAEMKHYSTRSVHTQPFFFQNPQMPSNYIPHNILQNNHTYQPIPAQYSYQNMPFTNVENTSNQQLQSVFTPPEQNSLCDTEALFTAYKYGLIKNCFSL